MSTSNLSINLRDRAQLVLLSAAAYALIDLPVGMTGLLPALVGLKNFLPVTLGLFFGPYGAAGGCGGCLLTALLLRRPMGDAALECVHILIMTLGMWGGWHLFSRSHWVRLKRSGHYLRYSLLVAGLSGVCGLASQVCGGDFTTVASAYALSGLLVGIPINILLASVLCVEQVLPPWCSAKDDAVLDLEAGSEALEGANEILEETAEERGLSMKRVFEVQSCLEEFSIRVFGAAPEARVRVRVRYDDAVSLRLTWEGKKYNPLHIGKEEDEIDVAGLKIIKHRALRASFQYQGGENRVHVVI